MFIMKGFYSFEIHRYVIHKTKKTILLFCSLLWLSVFSAVPDFF
jgi:hypothetical protein